MRVYLFVFYGVRMYVCFCVLVCVRMCASNVCVFVLLCMWLFLRLANYGVVCVQLFVGVHTCLYVRVIT